MRKSVNSVLILLFLSGGAALRGKTIRVPADQSTIQKGINVASNGDTVLVSPGTYFENVNFRGKRIVLTSRFSESGDLSFIQSTIINGSQPANADSASCVLIISGEDSTTVLQGFTITGGQGTKWIDEHGAGTYREGGGILIANSAPTIRFNVIINNAATNTSGVNSAGGGGIRAGDGNPKILNNVIARNAARYGAGIVLNYTGAIVKNNIITNNSGGQDYGGGALWMNHDGATPKYVENNTSAGNQVVAVYVWQGSSIIRNCILWADPQTSAVQIAVRSGGPSVTYSFVGGGYSGTGNLSGDPEFADTTFVLGLNSPCIDAGDTASSCSDKESSSSPGNAQSPSKGGLRNDIGAYGGPGAAPLPGAMVPTTVRSHGSLPPTEFRLYQNYPNPFNPTTSIQYFLARESRVRIEIFSSIGQRVEKLLETTQQAGYHTIEWNAEGLASGAYFCRMEAGESMQALKMVLLE